MTSPKPKPRLTAAHTVVVSRNGFVDSAMASASDGTGVTGLTVEATRAWARRKAAELGATVDDEIAAADLRAGKKGPKR